MFEVHTEETKSSPEHQCDRCSEQVSPREKVVQESLKSQGEKIQSATTTLRKQLVVGKQHKQTQQTGDSKPMRRSKVNHSTEDVTVPPSCSNTESKAKRGRPKKTQVRLESMLSEVREPDSIPLNSNDWKSEQRKDAYCYKLNNQINNGVEHKPIT
jgi:hypothetical protein